MTLVALDGTPLVAVGGCGRSGTQTLGSGSNLVVDAALEATILIGQIFTEDGSSHTIDTTGSSSLGWRSQTVTFANAGTSVSVGLAAVDTGAGPPARAVNVTDTITFDVAAVFTGGGGGITANAWQESVPTTGTKTIANGDLIAAAIQMTTRGGTDTVAMVGSSSLFSGLRPSITQFTSAAYSNTNTVPNFVITFSDGVRGYFWGGYVASVGSTSITFNSGSAQPEFGNYFQLPVPAKIYGFMGSITPNADFDLVLYSDPFGTPVAEKTISVDANTMGVAASGTWQVFLFPAPFTSTVNQPLIGSIKPGASSIDIVRLSLNIAAHQNAWSLGSNCYGVHKSSGVWSSTNSDTTRINLALLIGAFSDGVGAFTPYKRGHDNVIAKAWEPGPPSPTLGQKLVQPGPITLLPKADRFQSWYIIDPWS